MSPLGDHTTRKYDKGIDILDHSDCPGQIPEGHDMADVSARWLTWRQHAETLAQPRDMGPGTDDELARCICPIIEVTIAT